MQLYIMIIGVALLAKMLFQKIAFMPRAICEPVILDISI